MCELCYGNEVIYRFWVNHKRKEVVDDWLYCPNCYPDSFGTWDCPWYDHECEEITLAEYNELIKQGYKECLR